MLGKRAAELALNIFTPVSHLTLNFVGYMLLVEQEIQKGSFTSLG